MPKLLTEQRGERRKSEVAQEGDGRAKEGLSMFQCFLRKVCKDVDAILFDSLFRE